jgi:hypothetical protein
MVQIYTVTIIAIAPITKLLVIKKICNQHTSQLAPWMQSPNNEIGLSACLFLFDILLFGFWFSWLTGKKLSMGYHSCIHAKQGGTTDRAKQFK